MPAELPSVSRDDLLTIGDFLRRRIEHSGPQADRARIAQALTALWSATGFIAPFDWRAWLRERGEEWASDPAVIASAGLETLRRLATVHARTNRFVDGHLEQLLASGYIARFLDRVGDIARSGDESGRG